MAAAMSLQITATPLLPSIQSHHGSHCPFAFNSSVFHPHDYLPRYKAASVSLEANSMQISLPKYKSVNNSVDGIAKNLRNEQQMQPDQSIYDIVIKAAVRIKTVKEVQRVHAHVIKHGFNEDILVNNHFIQMYAKCGSLEDARQVFDKITEPNLISWNTIIAGYARKGQSEEALNIYMQMHIMGFNPDRSTFGSVLKSNGNLAIPGQGKEIHAQVIKNGFENDVFVASALVDMYAKCQNIDGARKLFDKMPERDLVTWTAMVSAYTKDGQSIRALKVFCQMHRSGIRPNAFTFTVAIFACTALVGLEQGRQFHALVVKFGLQSNNPVGNSLITMYSKCGSINDAGLVFHKMGKRKRNIISWSAMLQGYAYHGCGREALQLFETMKKSHKKPNRVTFIGVLSACSHAGLVKEGLSYFDTMSRDYGIMPNAVHYSCIVDLLGRAGLVDEAEDFINRMPCSSCDAVWRTLLGACRVHNNMEIGLRAAEHLLELAPHDASAYVLLSNIYAAAGRWEDMARVRKMMDDMGIEKKAGLSWLEVRSKLHRFVARDRSHPQTEDIYATLEELTNQLERAGYKPNTKLVLHDVEDEVKEQYLCHHSEKLAIAFGLISLAPGKSIKIVKNLRVCVDCHTFTKYVSKIVRREIVVRDVNRFHHFKDGICSCRDYW